MEEIEWKNLTDWLKLTVTVFAVLTIVLVGLGLNDLYKLTQSSNLYDLFGASVWLFLALLSGLICFGLFVGSGTARYGALALAIGVTLILYPFGIVFGIIPLFALILDKKTIKYFQ